MHVQYSIRRAGRRGRDGRDVRRVRRHERGDECEDSTTSQREPDDSRWPGQDRARKCEDDAKSESSRSLLMPSDDALDG